MPVASSSDPGEFEVEQFYVDRQINDAVTVRGGLFLMPFGLLNEHHEPTNFYGVQRNFVETLIIPSTWREGGFNFHGDTQSGFGWNAGLTTGFDLSKWDFARPNSRSTRRRWSSRTTARRRCSQPTRSSALANAHDLSSIHRPQLLRRAWVDGRRRHQQRQGRLSPGSSERAYCWQPAGDFVGRPRALDARSI